MSGGSMIECEDTISRKDALKALDYDIKSFEFKSGVDRHMNEIADLLNTIYEIQSDNIKALPPVQSKQIECEDAISMMDLLNNLHKHFPKGFETDEWWNSTHVLQAIKDCRPELFDLNYVPPVQPKYNANEWCHDCSEYDHEKHCCPRYNRIIRNTVEEMKQPKSKVGHWITEHPLDYFQPDEYKCSECGHYYHKKVNECPKCGAKMQEVEDGGK